MPYALTPPAARPGSLLVGLRGGALLMTEDAGESWTHVALALDDVISLQASLT